ncbi:hypothetical protein CBS101457_006198 [Exobasidium rhododendri]|nr:hypothetical protein CBS101457_006198 [Exobasidium rhododendri]
MTSESNEGPPPMQAKSAQEATAEEIAAPPEAVNMTDEEEMGAAANKDNSDSGKLKALLNVLRRMVGVKDLAAIRLSLPANLLEPVPNLEYWNYLDRGDFLTAIGDYDDALDRMLAVLRYTFTKELKFVHGKICKPYNSILGEHFRCHWDVQPPEVNENGDLIPRMDLLTSTPTPLQQSNSSAVSEGRSKKKGGSATASTTIDNNGSSKNSAEEANSRPSTTRGLSTISSTGDSEVNKTRRGLSKILLSSRSNKSSSAASTKSIESSKEKSPAGSFNSSVPTQPLSSAKGDGSNNEDDDGASITGSFKTTKSASAHDSTRRIAFLTEQVSHHPPISSFFVECKEAGVELYGVDQLSAKFTGTSVRIFPGEYNKGIFVRLTKNALCGAEGEEYQITHPTASINGLLRGSLWVAICETLFVTCRGGKREGDSGARLKAIVEYKDESWVLKAKYALEAVIYEHNPDTEDDCDKIRSVPQDRVIATIEGTWRGQIMYKKKGDKDSRLLVDLDQLNMISTKNVRPLDVQEDLESRKIWEPVTEAIVNKEFGQATKHKQEIEQVQREAAAERKKKGVEYKPQFFNEDISDGRPTLTEAGVAALEGEAKRKPSEAK